jgi:hypothetical protein
MLIVRYFPLILRFQPKSKRHDIFSYTSPLSGSGFVKYLRTDSWTVVLIHSAEMRKRLYIVHFYTSYLSLLSCPYVFVCGRSEQIESAQENICA